MASVLLQRYLTPGLDSRRFGVPAPGLDPILAGVGPCRVPGVALHVADRERAARTNPAHDQTVGTRLVEHRADHRTR
jgi:hypothetical protein